MPIEIKRQELLKTPPWNTFTSTNLTEFVRLGLISEGRKEHAKGVISWECEDTIVRLGILSRYHQEKTLLYQYGQGLFALILGVNGFSPIRHNPDLHQRILTVLEKGHALLIAEAQKTLPFFYDTSDTDLESETLSDEEKEQLEKESETLSDEEKKVLDKIAGPLMPLLMQFLGGSPEWSQYDTNSSGDPDRILENKENVRKSMLREIPKLAKSLSGMNLAKMLGNPTNRLTSKQKESLITEGFMSMKDPCSWKRFFTNLESYSEKQWNTFFTYLSMIHASTSLLPMIPVRISPFAPKQILQGGLIPALTTYAYFADSFSQYDRQLMDSFEPVHKVARDNHKKEIDRWLKPWNSNHVTELKTVTNIDTSTSIEEV